MDDNFPFYDFAVIDQKYLWISTYYGVIINSIDAGEKWGIQKYFNDLSYPLGSISMYNNQIGWMVGFPNLIYKTYNGGQIPLEPPIAPVLTSPASGAVLHDWFWYQWNVESNSNVSKLQVSTDDSFNNIVFESHYISHITNARSTCNYEKDKKYYWRVYTENQLGISEWSEVWNFTVDVTLLPVEDENNIISFSLSQNYPNPFNPITRIRYKIPERNIVSLVVYNVLGQKVTTLVDEEKLAGNYELQFDGSSLSSGIYFYQLKAGGFVETKKMVLLK